jgi:hypothetical protein
MFTFLNQKTAPWIYLFLSGLLVSTCLVLPMLMHAFIIGKDLRSAIHDDMATLIVDDNTLHIEGKVPSIIRLENGVTVLLHTKPDTMLLKSFPRHSILITEQALFYRRAFDIKKYPFENANIRFDDKHMELTPQLLRTKLDKHLVPVLTIVAILSIGLFFLVLLGLALFAAGISTVIDAFTNGPFAYLQFYNLSSLVLFLLVSFAVIMHRIHLIKWIHVLYFSIFYIVFVPGFSYFLQKIAAKTETR